MKEKTADIDILEELKNKQYTNKDILGNLVLSEEEYTAISTLIAENKELKEKNKEIEEEDVKIRAKFILQLDNYILKSKVEELLKEKIEWCIKASNSGLNAIQYACSKEDEIERIERQKNISTMISILKEILQELLDERNNADV